MENPILKKEKINYFDNLKKKLGNFENYTAIGKYKSKNNEEKTNYMKAFEENSDLEWPKHSLLCVCGHWIKKQCYIQNILTNEIIVVGNCCIKKFNIKKKCIQCQNTHNRTKYNICIDCEFEIKIKVKKQKELNKENLKLQKEIYKYDNKILKFGKYKFKTYKYVYDNDLNYIEWCHNKYLDNKESKTIFDDIIYYHKLKRKNI